MALRQVFRGTRNCDLVIPYKTLPPPSYPTFIPKLLANFLAIEKWATYFTRNCISPCAHEVVFSHQGVLTSNATPPWQSGSPRTLTRLKVLIGGDVDSADVTIQAFNNGNEIVALTIPAGDNTLYVESADLDPALVNFGTDGQFLTFQASNLGDNVGTDWTIIAYFTCGPEGGDPPDPGGVIG